MNPPASGSGKRRRGGRSGQSIIGFTEAELGLFLALLFFGLSQLGQTGTPKTTARAQATLAADSSNIRNPRLAQLLALARRLDSLERAVRTANARDSAVAARLARLQRERDSLMALTRGQAPGVTGGVPRAAAAVPRVTSERLIAVEREIATAQLERSTSATTLAATSGQADATRRELDAIAPSVSRLVAEGQPGAPATAALAAAGTPGSGPGAAGASGSGLGAARADVVPATRDTMAMVRALAGAPTPPVPGSTLVASGGLGATGARGIPGAPGSPGSGASGSGASGSGSPGTGTLGGAGGVPSGGVPSGGAPSGGSPTGAGAVRILGAAVGGAGSAGGAASGPGRSRQTPTCIELRVDSASVADVLIVSSDRYEARGTTGSLDLLLQTLAPDLARARRNQCRNNVRIRTAANLAVDDYILALNALLPYFNTELAPPASGR